mmetsp:Transcript_20881/g.31139  ORF Transcript_20881/g.31139 Transcript_20881/m.31139 type:complete len:147 (+) Transcript_20881:1199-1639(+)
MKCFRLYHTIYCTLYVLTQSPLFFLPPVCASKPGSDVWNALYYTLRKPPFTTASLIDCDYMMDFSKVNTPLDSVAIIATKPLTKDEDWIEMKKGELLLFDKGQPCSAAHHIDEIEKQGRGLFSKVKSMQRIVSKISHDAKEIIAGQ